jgi:hypothetical protein
MRRNNRLLLLRRRMLLDLIVYYLNDQLGRPMKLLIVTVLVAVGLATEAWQAYLEREWLRNCEGIEITLLDAAGIRRDVTIRGFSNADCRASIPPNTPASGSR